MEAVPYRFLVCAGLVLLAAGIPIWLASAVSVMKAYNSDRLVTSGMFAVCRYPLYAAAILLVLPGGALLTGSWPVMVTPLVAYGVFKLLIRDEDKYLYERFGAVYLEYRARVHEFLPTLRHEA